MQRVVRELIRNWPADIHLQLAAYDILSDQLVSVSDRVVAFAIEASSDRYSDEEVSAAIKGMRSSGERPLGLQASDTLLAPEVFFYPYRIWHYLSLTRSGIDIRYIVYDLLPFTNPDIIRLGPGGGHATTRYLNLIVSAKNRCFISTNVRDELASRVMKLASRDDLGPVITLGADALGVARQSFDPTRNLFVCIGALDGKKGQEIVYSAFRGLSNRQGARLTFLGRIPHNPAEWLRPLLDDVGLEATVIDNPTDDEILRHLHEARASFFVSQHEGFGLPAVESLSLGVPIVVSSRLPAVQTLPGSGQIRLDTVDVASVAGAMTTLMDDAEAQRLWQDAASLSLRGWRDYARDIAAWASS